jgi:YggT family protein
MFVIGNFLMALAQVLDIILNIYMWVIIIAALISWVNPDPYNPIVRFLYRATEPVLRPIRRTIGTALGGIDVSPIIAILGIMFLRYFIVRSLIDIAARLR